MESFESQIMRIVYWKDGWYIIDGGTKVLAGPYNDHADAVEQVKTRAHRIAQGWAP
jgi:hypothetical protein